VSEVQARQHEHADLFQVRQLVQQLRQATGQHAQPRAITGGSKYGVRNSAKAIMLTLSRVGTKAGTENGSRY
jgi:hypothetical protein